MARCPTCGKEVEKPSKEWDLGKIQVVSQYRILFMFGVHWMCLVVMCPKVGRGAKWKLCVKI